MNKKEIIKLLDEWITHDGTLDNIIGIITDILEKTE